LKGKILGRQRLGEIGPLFTPDTILSWHRKLIARKWDYSQNRKGKAGRPTVSAEVETLVLRMAAEREKFRGGRRKRRIAHLWDGERTYWKNSGLGSNLRSADGF
jgi:hypothetical protein